MSAPRYISTADAALAIGISRQALSIRCRKGSVIGAIRIGNVWAIPSPPKLAKPLRSRASEQAKIDEAMRLVDSGWTSYAAAKRVGIALSTIYRARKR